MSRPPSHAMALLAHPAFAQPNLPPPPPPPIDQPSEVPSLPPPPPRAQTPASHRSPRPRLRRGDRPPHRRPPRTAPRRARPAPRSRRLRRTAGDASRRGHPEPDRAPSRARQREPRDCRSSRITPSSCRRTCSSSTRTEATQEPAFGGPRLRDRPRRAASGSSSATTTGGAGRGASRARSSGPRSFSGSTTDATVGDPTHAQSYWGIAFDVGWQEVIPGGFTAGVGAGLEAVRMAGTGGVVPRFLSAAGLVVLEDSMSKSGRGAPTPALSDPRIGSRRASSRSSTTR